MENINDLFNQYLSLDAKSVSNEKDMLFIKIMNLLNIDVNKFNCSVVNIGIKNLVIESLYNIIIEKYTILNKPLKNLFTILDNDSLDRESAKNIIDDYCNLINILLKRKNDVKTKNLA